MKCVCLPLLCTSKLSCRTIKQQVSGIPTHATPLSSLRLWWIPDVAYYLGKICAYVDAHAQRLGYFFGDLRIRRWTHKEMLRVFVWMLDAERRKRRRPFRHTETTAHVHIEKKTTTISHNIANRINVRVFIMFVHSMCVCNTQAYAHIHLRFARKHTRTHVSVMCARCSSAWLATRSLA